MNDEGMNRRAFLRTAGAGVATVGTAGTAAAQEGEGGGGEGGGGGSGGQVPDFGGWMEDAPYYEGPSDVATMTGQSEVTVTVGGSANSSLSFEPGAIHVSKGTKVIWEWSGEGGGHNVEAQSGADFASETTSESGATFEQTFEQGGIITYFCNPHRGQGMLGAVAVGQPGTDFPSQPAQAAELPPVVGDGPRTLGVATSIAMLSTLGLAYFFMKYGGDYQADE